MRRFFYTLAVVGFIAFCNCSRIPENNDPVLGIWVRTDLNDAIAKNTDSPISEEWIFNDVYLGRYHQYSENEVVFLTDFRWEVVDDVYTISYSQGDLPPVKVSLKQSSDSEMLQLESGEVFAIRK